MAVNFPGPWQVDIHYVVDGYEHTQKLNLDVETVVTVGMPFDEIEINTRAAGTVFLDAAIDAWETLQLPRFSDTAAFTGADLYFCQENSFNRFWYSSYGMSGVGTHAQPYSKANETIHTYRTQEGGIMKLVWEECPIAFFAKVSLAAGTLYEGTTRDFVLSDDNWILARDTSWPIAPLHLLYGQNEAIFKKRYR